MDIRHVQKYEYILGREDRWSRNEGRKLKLEESLTKRLTVVANEKLREWIQIRTPVHLPSLNISKCFKMIVNSEFTVHQCAKWKKTSIICVANLHGLSWDTTRVEHCWNEDESSNVHRETGAFTMRVKPGLVEMQQRQQRRQQQSHVNTSENKVKLQKRKAPSKGQNQDWDSRMTRVEKTLFEILSFKYVYFDTMMDVTVEMREQN